MSIDLRDRIKARLATYETDHGCSLPGDRSCAESEVIADGLAQAIGYAWPHSTYAVLRAMLWTWDHPGPPDDWWSEVDQLMDLLDVRADLSPSRFKDWTGRYGEHSTANWRRQINSVSAYWLAEVITWPKEDKSLILEWLRIARGWEFVRECGSAEAKSAIQFWSDVLEGKYSPPEPS